MRHDPQSSPGPDGPHPLGPGRPELAHLRLRARAHSPGLRGHWLTKIWSYATTLGALRAARRAWRAKRRGGTARRRPGT
ncbi:MAG TPA: replication initiator, partial [Acidimicrobiales bacterium]|nr:replication initiator [Acidimicrobiales bacterium]